MKRKWRRRSKTSVKCMRRQRTSNVKYRKAITSSWMSNPRPTELNRPGFAAFVRKEERDTEWPYNGFAKELIGLKPGDTKTIKHTFPEDWKWKHYADKDTEMEVTVKTVRAVSIA